MYEKKKRKRILKFKESKDASKYAERHNKKVSFIPGSQSEYFFKVNMP